MIDVTGRVALVTAGAKGLGAEVARRLAAAGADVAVTYAQDGVAARGFAAEVERGGRRCLPLQADARDFGRAARVVEEARAALGGLHILVCGAG
ncbi:MAG: SDR family NAD(P)-dependent oxidoreductase, partial [Candidatus Rokubacteria bacterium]|nr:SDR family NAD(P)-dependent oxidoreductase [Candidatus Rokubacteria bacterium]